MHNKRQFLRCEHCGNIVGVIWDSGVKMVCCGQEMTELAPNTVDAAQEKHVPALTREGTKLTVKVGSVAHPMTKEHHIAWIALAQGASTQRMTLDFTGEPCAQFCLAEDGPVTVYAYCNLHGLWMAEG